MLFRKNVESVTRIFTKAIADLEKVEEAHRAKAGRIGDRIMVLSDEAFIARQEAAKAATVRTKLKETLGL